MNIIEAVKSGKRFRRPGGHWLQVNTTDYNIRLLFQDILATDWEIEERIEITESEFDAICNEVGFRQGLIPVIQLKKRLFEK